MGGVKIACTSCFNSSFHSLLPPSSSPSSSQPFPSTTPSISPANITQTRRLHGFCGRPLPHHQRSPSLGTTSPDLSRRSSLMDGLQSSASGRVQLHVLRRASTSASSLHADEFAWRLQELALKLRHDACSSPTEVLPDSRTNQHGAGTGRCNPIDMFGPPWPTVLPEPPNWLLDPGEVVPASIEMKANSVHLPVSLRMIKQRRKNKLKQWPGGLAGECARSSFHKAFSSMVFIVRELHTYTIQMRGTLFFENLEGILSRVQGETNASFVWLFQQIFSCTPTLMVYVMLLLTNFTVCSISLNSAAVAAAGSPSPPAQALVAVDQDGRQALHQNRRLFDASSVRPFSVGGSGSGGGKVKPVAGATDDGGRSGRPPSHFSRTIVQGPGKLTAEGGGKAIWTEEDEVAAWNGMVEEASRMKAGSLMEPETLQRLVAPVSVELEPDDCWECLQTEHMYQKALSHDPDDVLLLSNFAQFLFLVLHDHDRAECYFKMATGGRPADAEAWNRYANFMWVARKDLGAAEEAYLEAIAADPTNSYHAASYAHFLWNTGADDTCYPLDGGDAA